MAGKHKNRTPRKKRNQPDSSTTPPSHSQILKKFKIIDTPEVSDCESVYSDAKGPSLSDFDGNPSVSTENMADVGQQVSENSVTQSLIHALKDPEVIHRLVGALRDEIRAGFKAELKLLNAKIQERDVKIRELEEKVEGLEMYGRRNGVRIYGVPETPHENTDNIVLKLADEIEANIPPHALGRSHRVGPTTAPKPRPIIAKFVGHNFKVNFMRNKRKLRKDDDEDDESVQDGPPKPPPRPPIFVNEDLTSKRAGWAKKARGWRKSKKIKDTWTRDGVLFVKTNQDEIKRANCDRELDDLENDVAGAYAASTESDDNQED